MNKKVIIIEKLFPLYRKAVFDLLNQKVELKILHGKNNSGIKSTSTVYSEVIPSFQYGKKETSVLLFPICKILKYKPQIVICDFALGILNLPIIMFVCKLLKIEFVFWSHGYNRKTGFKPETSWLDKYRLFLLRLADANILYSQMDKKILQKYLNKEKIFVAQNTIDTSPLIKIRERLENEGKINIKKRLDVKHEFNIIFISRMLRSKKPELLIDIYEILRNLYGKIVGVHFIGDGEMLPLIKKEVHLKSYDDDYYFHGPIYNDILNGEFLFISDIMVIPGYLGLSINVAFCFDCPVISYKEKNGYPAHSPEVEYLVNNKTGFLVEEQTPEAMANVINLLLENIQLRNEFTKNIRFSVENEFPLEKMIRGVLDCVNFLQK